MKKRILVVIMLVILSLSFATMTSAACNHNYVLQATWVVGYVDAGDTCDCWMGTKEVCSKCGDIRTSQFVQHLSHSYSLTGGYLTSWQFINMLICGKYWVNEYECNNCQHYKAEYTLQAFEPHDVQVWHQGGYNPNEGGYLYYGDCSYCFTTISYFSE